MNPGAQRGWRAGLTALAALVLLNTLLSLRNWWPTPGVLPDLRLSPEAVAVWCAALLVVAWRGRPSPRVVTLFALAIALLALGRYANVTVPTLFGRPVNLYWDGLQIPRFLWVTARDAPAWAVAGVMLAVLAGLALLWRGLCWLAATLLQRAAPMALQRRWTALPTGVAVVLVALHLASAVPAFTWHVVTDPITPTYARQARLLATAVLPGAVAATVPASTALARAMADPPRAVAGLRGRDVQLLFLESYGAIAHEHPAIAPGLVAPFERLAADVQAAGYRVVSAYVTAATFAGASELSHLSLLSGSDLSNPLHHDLLLTTGRPTLMHLFAQAGYETFGLYPALTWDWAERSFYGFDRFLDARDLDWRGPPLGYWKVPDQFTLARFEQLHPPGPRPRLLFFPTITSHLPFGPVPPCVDSGERLLSADPFGAAENERLRNAYVDWLDMRPNYVGMFDYTTCWLGRHLRDTAARDAVHVWVGDHQPAASVSGEGADWVVPVHVLARDDALLDRLQALGFRPGLVPQRPALGGMHDLTALLLAAFGNGDTTP
ncbi:MAG: hypothetical protein H6932_09165 [Burkholderiaceae bacterium]|nr:hypothetical protein [Burkholderiaceae bacterium]